MSHYKDKFPTLPEKGSRHRDLSSFLLRIGEKKKKVYNIDTWRMIGRLYHDRLISSNFSADGNAMDTDADGDVDNEAASVALLRTSEKKIVELLFKRESFLRQAQAVVDWLEQVTWCCCDFSRKFRPNFCWRRFFMIKSSLKKLTNCGKGNVQ